MKQAYEAPQVLDIGKVIALTLGGSGPSPDCGNDGFNNGKRPENSEACPPTSPTG